MWRSWRWAGETGHLTSCRPGGPRCLVVHGLQFKCQVKCTDLLCRQHVGVLNDRSAIISKPFSHLSYGCFLCVVLLQVVTMSFSATSPKNKLCTKWAFICHWRLTVFCDSTSVSEMCCSVKNVITVDKYQEARKRSEKQTNGKANQVSAWGTRLTDKLIKSPKSSWNVLLLNGFHLKFCPSSSVWLLLSDVLFTLCGEGILSKLCWCAPFKAFLFVLKPQFHSAWDWRTVERMDFKLTGDLVTVFIWRQTSFLWEFIMVQLCVLSTTNVFTFAGAEH